MESQFNFIHMPQKHIKMEFNGSSSSLISPPPTPSPPAPCHSGSTSSGSKRPRPYPALSREPYYTMSTSPAYPSWSSTGRPHHPVERKPTDGDKLAGYAAPQFINGSSYIPGGSDLGSLSSSSSLIGAMGETTAHPRRSSSSGGRRMYLNTQPHNAMWDNNVQPNINMNTSTYRTVPGHGSLSFADMNSSLMTMDNYAAARNIPSPQSPTYGHYGQGHSSTQPSGNNGMTYENVSLSSYPSPLTPSSDTDDEVHRLRRKVRELEIECTRNRNIIDSLRRPAAIGLPTPSPSPSFQESWKVRTEIRKKMFCSPNRAGNALCSWHDSRRERRAYPPRQAPPGFLNCGCSYEEALFEETLSRNNVGSYHPGETVRMDPALRNPLLKLLENRYGYKDGDFERNPHLDCWVDGESPSSWELKAQSGPASRRRTDDRH